MRFKGSLIVVLLFSAHALQAQGISIVQQETREGKTTTNQVYLDKTHIRNETHASGDDMVVVFDGAAQVVRMINVDKKTYSEIDKAQMEQMKQRLAGASTQMSAAQQKMEEQMKNMTPEQRAMVEQMMRGRGGMPTGAPPAAPARPQYRPAGSDKVGQWSCAKYEGFRGQEKVMEVCTIDPKELGLTASDFDVAKQLVEFLRTLSPQSADQAVMIGTPEEQGFPGVPVRRTAYANGKVTYTVELKEVKRETLPASTFEAPAGFSKQTIGMRP